MTRLMTGRIFSLLFALLALTAAAEQPLPWPVRRQVDLSSSFGDLRPNRFHAGVDIRTGAQVGTRTYSPVSGYLWRIKMSYNGYGKGMYVIGDDGRIYVYGHLHDFAPAIDRLVKTLQMRARRYYLDATFPRDSIRVKQGEYLGLTGRTGAKAPHLHFEVRSADNHPLNPLTHGFTISDRVRPTFVRIGFKLVDDRSVMPGGRRKVFFDLPAPGAAGSYRLDTTLTFSSPFGVLVHCFDQHRVGGMRGAVYDLKLYIDDTLYYAVRFDTVYFNEQRSINLEYDYVEAAEGEKRVRRLFHRIGNTYPGSGPVDANRGLFGWDSTPIEGLHRGRIVATDGYGNTSRLTFDFIWDPDSGPRIPVTDSAAASGVVTALDYVIVDDGLLITLNSTSELAGSPEIRLYYGDSLVGVERPYLLGGNRYACFIPPSGKYVRIDRMTAGSNVSGGESESSSRSLNVFLVGTANDSQIRLDSTLMLQIGRDHLFEPRYIELRKDPSNPSILHILPEVFVCRNDFVVSLLNDEMNVDTKQRGVCWLDPEEDRWMWLDTYRWENRLEAEATGGGAYRVLTDAVAPRVTALSIRNGLTYFDPRPAVEFILSDSLSGIEDDQSILIELDGNWMIPEYDPQTEVCQTRPMDDLPNGRHDLYISATDRAGNRTEHRLHFFVNKEGN